MRYIKLTLVLALTMPLLQACFPVVATGVGAGVLMAEDRRSTGAYVEDGEIEIKANRRISDQLGNQVHIDATSYNRILLLTGEAPTEALKNQVETIVQGIPNVRKIVNYITIATPTSLATRGNDALITSNVKARFVSANQFRATDVKVVTENGVVYLMGLVTKQEGEQAINIARESQGVQKVVAVFEYTN